MNKILLTILMMVLFFSCKEDVNVQFITLDKPELTLKIGEKYQLKVNHTPIEAKTPEYTWYISIFNANDNVVSVSQDGTVTALKEGNSTVVVEAKDVLDANGNPVQAVCIIKVLPIEAESIILDKSEIIINAGDEQSIKCSFIPENTTDQKISWKSSDSNIAFASVKPNNILSATIKGVGAGEAIITAYLISNNSISAQCIVKVNPAKLEGLSINEKEKIVIQGESFKLTPIFIPEYATNKNVEWTSSDENIATIDNNGNVKTIHFGECVIKAIAEDGGFEAQCKVTVKPVPLENIKFEKYSYNLEIGGTKQLKIVYIPENAGNKKIKWSSSNSIVATVDENGLVKGNTCGNTDITAISEDGGYLATCKVYVVEINKMMQVYFPSSSVAIINGFYTGVISCAIRNNSSQTVKLTKFWVYDTNNYNTVAETTDEALLGTELAPGQTVALSGRFNSVYEPAFCWELEYNGLKFTTYNSYGDNSFKSDLPKSKGNSSDMIQLYRE